MLRAWLSAALSCAVLLGLGASPGFAAPEGVVVDPSTPAGREYAIPLDQARRQYGGGGSTSRPSSGSPGAGPAAAPRFGEGISPVSKRASVSARLATGSAPAAATTLSGARRAAAIQAAGQPGSGTALGLGVAAAVLLLGLGLGVVLRLRPRSVDDA